MARGSKNYSEVTHNASKKGTKEKQKAVWDMIGAKKKLHEMVEALIGGDSKAAAAALHEYLQQKTRAILGESDMDMDLDMDAADDLEGAEGDLEGAEDDLEDCEACGGEGCEACEDHDDEMGDLEGAEDDLGDAELDLDMEEPMVRESNETKATPTFKGAHNNAAKDLGRKVKGKLNYGKSSGSGSKKSNSTEATPPFKGAHNNAAKELSRKVKGDIKFAGSGKKAKLTKPHNNAAPGLDRKVKGKVDFGG